MVDISSLESVSIAEMHAVFNVAFKKYPISINLNQEDFKRKFFAKLQLDRRHSAGAFENDRLVGFIYQTIGYHNNNKVAYNGGTGVLPDHRGKHLTARMYDYLQEFCSGLGLAYFLLESITHNAPAVKIYRKCGFYVSRLLRCFFLEKEFLPKIKTTSNVTYEVMPVIKWEMIKDPDVCRPGFEEQIDQLKRNQSLYTMVVAYAEGIQAGVLLFDRESGRVSYLCVDTNYRRQGMAAGLLRKMAELTYAPVIAAINIDERASDLSGFFRRLTFENRFDQYEMIREI
jgi:ribosomal protein S18 acetylase RimI-like enzyme